MVNYKLLFKDYCNANRFVSGLALFFCLHLAAATDASSPDISALADQFPPESSDLVLSGDFDEFENFDVLPSLPLAGAVSNYDLSFQLNRGDYHKLDQGGFAFVFPDRFDLRQITLVTIDDDDERSPRYQVEHFSSSRHFLFVSLERLRDDDDDGNDDNRLSTETSIIIHVESIKNSSQPGRYEIAGLAYDKKRHLVAGPTVSNSFELSGDGIAGLVVLPEEDQNVPLGGSINFSAWSVDQSGNMIAEVNASWSFSDDSDPIGSLNGSLFTAESIGIGRVRAEFGDFEAFSGLIRIVSGPVLSYVPGSLTPLVIFAGVDTEFSFDLLLEESFPEDVTIHQASFTVFGNRFSSTTVLTSESGLLIPGINRLSSGTIIVPQSQVGGSLGVRTEIVYRPVSDPVSQLTFRSELDSIIVREPDGGLAVDFIRDRLNLIMPGRSKSMFSMSLTNLLEAKTFSIVLNSMSIFLFSDGLPVDAASVFDLDATGFFKGDLELSHLEASGNRLDLTLHFIIAPLRSPPRFNFMAVAQKTDLRGITLEINLADMEARYFDGPAAGELAPISSSGDSKVRFDYVFKGPTLEQSVVIENNPFNPDEELLHFTYELPVASDIEFRILTLIGEEVYSLDIPFGSLGATLVGENEISWDGRNDRGHTVLNGVYVVFIRIVETGESTLTKVAVLK